MILFAIIKAPGSQMDSLISFFFFFFFCKLSFMLIVTMVTEDLDQAFHMKCHDLFSLKENKYSLILFHNDM